MVRRPRRQLVLMLSAEEYDRLVVQASAAERDPWQQARVLLRRGLDVEPAPDIPVESTVEADVA